MLVLALAASIPGASSWTNPLVRRAPTVAIPWSPIPFVRGAPARAPKRSWAVDPAAAAAQADSARSPDDEVLRRLDALTLRRVIERLEKIPEQAYKSVAADLLGR